MITTNTMSRRCQGFLALLMCFGSVSSGLAQFDANQAVKQTMGQLIRVPFTLSNGLMLVTATIDGHKGSYLLDTGSPLIVLNNAYLRLNLAVYPDPLHTLDTLPQGETGTAEQTFWTVRTLQMGSHRIFLDTLDVGPPTPAPAAANAMLGWGGHLPPGILGTLGLNVLAPFETIIDYKHQQLVLIPLDAAGHRIIQASAYRPLHAAPLVPYHMHVSGQEDTAAHWWGVVARLGGGVTDTLELDTGSPDDMLSPATVTRLGTHVRTAPSSSTSLSNTPIVLDTVTVAGHVQTGVSFSATTVDFPNEDMLGYPWLERQGLVGFNFRTHQLLLYASH